MTKKKIISSKTIAVFASMRLRTLPLSLAGVVLGILLAASKSQIDILCAALIVLTTICLQVLANLCNELGDSQNGTDTELRQGPKYSLQKGSLSAHELKKLIFLFVLLSMFFGAAMIWVSFGTLFCIESYILLVLGALAIVGAIKYTIGHKPYGYRGLGDISVFIFFGLVAVCGSYYLANHELGSLPYLAAISIGFFSVAVLNVNNIRDMCSDAATRKTVAIRLGLRNARIYQTLLISAGWSAIIAHSCINQSSIVYLPLAGMFIWHLYGLWTRRDKELDPMLPLLVVSTFILAIVVGTLEIVS